jgi:hypothetical protein
VRCLQTQESEVINALLLFLYLKYDENRVLRRKSGPKMKWLETGEESIMGSFITRTLCQILLGRSNQGG